MRITIAVLAAIAFCAAACAYAEFSCWDKGAWPQSWPRELEPLRKQSRSIQGGKLELITHHLPFGDREEFESAWPHLLAVKTPGAPIVLVSSPSSHWHFGETAAGVFVNCPPDFIAADGPNLGTTDFTFRWMPTTYIELVVDGEIVDLNRISLPADTPIIDERFTSEDVKSPAQKTK